MLAPVDLAAYRAEAEAFASALDREYYLHFSGQQEEFEIEPIYERHALLFGREAVDALREAEAPASLVEFAVHGLVGRETKAEEAELARREAALEVELDGERLPFRAAAVAQANEPDPDRRAAIEAARNALTGSQLNPLLRQMLERSHAVSTELGWPSMAAMCQELSGIDLLALVRQTEAFLTASEAPYEPLVEPEVERHLGLGFGRLRRSDLPAFFRAPTLDRSFPSDHLERALSETLAAIGIDLRRQPGVRLDTEERPKKSPRAFCAPVRVPDEVYLVIAPMGGRDDYAALFHEAGHTEHYANVDRHLPMEERYLGDNSVTEGFAFLLEHLTSEPEWLRRRLRVGEPEPIAAHSQAVKLVFLRRYCAKLAYELELHGAPPALDPLERTYAERLSAAVHVDWPSVTWLSDVDPFFYAARYLRAWALETRLRGALRERFGGMWFEDREAGAFLRELWRRGQPPRAEELLDAVDGTELDFSVLLDDVGIPTAAA
jgi:hypothetical protein